MSARVVQCRDIIRVSSEFRPFRAGYKPNTLGSMHSLGDFLCDFTLYRIVCLRVSSYVLCVRSGGVVVLCRRLSVSVRGL